MTAVMTARGLGRSLPGDPPIVLVADADLTIEPGTFTAIVGPSGCGKSSLLYLLGLIDRPTTGSLALEGVEIAALDGDARAQLRLERFGFVFQFHFLLPEFTALENVLIPLRRLGRLDLAAARTRAMDLLEQFGLSAKVDRTPDRISGGERQRVAIARALANDPTLILADEPTGDLDSANSRAVIDLFRSLAHREGRSVVCVTHDPEIARRADRRVAMLDGRIVSQGLPPS
ncbi:MAG TPA: ABC transporter ATP-binding protein [Novosphingobium sp.]